MATGFTAKQRIFIEAYLDCLNATEAARRAGYKGNDATLAVVGHENLRKPYIRAEVERRMADRAMPQSELLFRLNGMARASMADFVTFKEDEDGVSQPCIDLAKARDAGKLQYLKKLRIDSRGIQIEIIDPLSALTKIGTHLGTFREQSVNLDIDLSKLTDEQLDRIIDGEDPLRVVTGTGAGGA